MHNPKDSAMCHITTSQPQAARPWQVHCADTYRERSMGIACRHAQKAAQHSTARHTQSVSLCKHISITPNSWVHLV
jgi:hypothetical protein